MNLETDLVPCALCAAESSTSLCKNDSLFIVRCDKCGLVFANPQPTENALRQLYSEDLINPEWKSDYFKHPPEGIRRLWRDRIRDLQRWENRTTVSILDIGSGCGDFLYYAKQIGWRTYGSELSPKAAEISKQKYGISVEIGDLFEMKYQKNYFDMITLWHVLEHMRDPVSVLKRAHELLVPRGLLVVEVPNLNCLVRKSYRFPLSVTLHLYHFSPATLSGLVQKAGFEVLECKQGNTGFLYHNMGKIYAKKVFNTFSYAVERMFGINIGDSIRLYARRGEA